MKPFIAFICLVLLLSGCNAQELKEDSGSLPENESFLSQAETESSSLPESSSSPEESSLSSQSEALSYGQEVSEPGLASGSLQSQKNEAVSAADISSFEAKYYLPLGVDAFDEQFYSENGEMLDWGKIDTSKVVQSYKLIYENPSAADEFDAFVTAYKKGKFLSELIEPDNEYYATVSVTNQSYSTGMVILEKENDRFMIHSCYLGDDNDSWLFSFPNNGTLAADICSRYDPAATEVKFVMFSFIGCGLLFSDGQQESIVFTYPIQDLRVKANVLYSTDQVMENIIATRDSIVRPQHEPEVNSDGEINYWVG